MNRGSYARKGFTLVELLMSVAIILLVIVGATAICIMSMTALQEGGAQITLQRRASTAMEKMVRGVDGTNGIREADAESVSCPDSSTIEYTSEGVGRKFYKSDDKLMYDPDTSVSGTDLVITENVSGLTFTKSGNMVTANLVVEEQMRNKVLNTNLSTRVKLRN